MGIKIGELRTELEKGAMDVTKLSFVLTASQVQVIEKIFKTYVFENVFGKKLLEDYIQYNKLIKYVQFHEELDGHLIIDVLKDSQKASDFFMKIMNRQAEGIVRAPDVYENFILYKHLTMQSYRTIKQPFSEKLFGEIIPDEQMEKVVHLLLTDDSFNESSLDFLAQVMNWAGSKDELVSGELQAFQLVDYFLASIARVWWDNHERLKQEAHAEKVRREQEAAALRKQLFDEREAIRIKQEEQFRKLMLELHQRILDDLQLGRQGKTQHFVQKFERDNNMKVTDYVAQTTQKGIEYLSYVEITYPNGQLRRFLYDIPEDAKGIPKENYSPRELLETPVTAMARLLQETYQNEPRVFEDQSDYFAWRAEVLADKPEPVVKPEEQAVLEQVSELPEQIVEVEDEVQEKVVQTINTSEPNKFEQLALMDALVTELRNGMDLIEHRLSGPEIMKGALSFNFCQNVWEEVLNDVYAESMPYASVSDAIFATNQVKVAVDAFRAAFVDHDKPLLNMSDVTDSDVAIVMALVEFLMEPKEFIDECNRRTKLRMHDMVDYLDYKGQSQARQKLVDRLAKEEGMKASDIENMIRRTATNLRNERAVFSHTVTKALFK